MNTKKNIPSIAMRALVALIEVVMPRSKEFNPNLQEYIADYIDKYVGYFPIHMKLGFPLGLILLEFGGYIFTQQFKRFTAMTMSERDTYIKNWANSKIQIRRELIRGVKGLVMVAFYSHPIVMEHMGYDIKGHIGVCVAKEFA